MTDIHTYEAESHCYALGTQRLYPNSQCKLRKVCREEEQSFLFTQGFDRRWLSQKLKLQRDGAYGACQKG